ncbi:MAG: pitrilysin family protein [Dehalococcoidia bacterium]|jgi:predicted Zn-dependent peptidase
MVDEIYQRTTLSNGLRVVTAPMPFTRSVSISIYLGAGSRYEEPAQAGISHMAEHLVFKGTERYPSSREISEIVDSVGGVMNAVTDRELTVYYGKVARPHFDMLGDILSDLLRHPLLAAQEMEKERGVILEELAAVADSPPQLVDQLIDQVMWPDQPLGRDVGGSRETVSTMTREMVLAYMGRQYVAENAVVGIAGNVSHDEALALVEREMGDWQRGLPGGWRPAWSPPQGPRLAVQYKKTEQAHISLAVEGMAMEHPDRPALDLLSVILGEGMSSRLFLELRERLGLCYDVHSYASHYQDAGSLAVYAAVDPKNALKALTALMGELARIREDIDDEEVARAKELSRGRVLLRMEDTRSVSGWTGVQELLTGKVLTVDDVLERVMAVTTADLLRVAKQTLRREALNLAVVGPFRSDGRFLPLLDL